MITALYIGNKKLDLFEDDNIVIKNSVSKIEDITKVFTETSNSFSVPASDNNNNIFKHYYNASVNNPFDARKLVLGAIYLDGLHHKTGNFKLNKVIVKSQKASSYSLDFFGLLTQLKELVGKDKLNSLDFSAYDFAYNYTNVKNRLTDSAATSDVLNTLLVKRRYIYDSNTSTANTDTVINIANNNTANTSGIVYQDTHSSIKSIRIIEAIEAKYNITFSREFFSTDNFSNLYLLLNGGSFENEFKENLVLNTSNDATLENNRTLLSTNLTFSDTNTISITVILTTGNINYGYNFTSIIKSNGVEIHRIDSRNTTSVFDSGVYEYTISKSSFINFENLTFTIISDRSINYRYRVTRQDTSGDDFVSTRTIGDLQNLYLISDSVPDIEIIDFLKGVFQMFKLIVVPTSDTNLFVDTYNNYYSSGINRDITSLIDFSKVNIESGEFINEISYKFKEAQTILAQRFKELNGIDYGNLELKILGDNGKLVEGESVEIDLPFENMIYEKLTDLNLANNFTTNVVYGLLQDDNQEPVIIEPHFHYISVFDLINSVKILNDSSGVELLSGDFCTPIHKNATNTTTFGEEIDEHSGAIMTNTLYSNFQKTFIESSFNIKRRLYNYKLKNATIDLINNLKLNDNIIIKGRAYRIDSYDTNITTREIEFNLINIT